MATITIPPDGLELVGTIFTDHASPQSSPTTVQALHLSVPEHLLSDIVNCARKGTEKLVYSVGKPGRPNVGHPSCHRHSSAYADMLFLDHHLRQQHISL